MASAGESNHIKHHFRRFDDAEEYTAHVRPFLLAAEAENNVLLGILNRLVSGDHDYGEPLLLATVERNVDSELAAAGDASSGGLLGGASSHQSSLLGCVWKTPPFKLGMTRMPGPAAALAARAVSKLIPDLDMAFGPTATVRRFAEVWSDETGAGFSEGMQQGVYLLEQVRPPQRRASGEMVRAGHSDLPLVIDWGTAFRRDTHVQAGEPAALGRRLIRDGAMYLWVDDGKPRSMAAAVAVTDNGARVGWVYTPREARGRGYATALTADLSQRLLDGGRKFCFLYADLANPTSTGIYERLGYRKVVDAMDVIFDS